MKNRIYIAGPVAHMPDLNKQAFDAAQETLTNLGWEVENPLAIAGRFGTPEEIEKSFEALRRIEGGYDYSRGDVSGVSRAEDDKASFMARFLRDYEFATIRSCCAIYLLRGWEYSIGTKEELMLAISQKLKIIVEGA